MLSRGLALNVEKLKKQLANPMYCLSFFMSRITSYNVCYTKLLRLLANALDSDVAFTFVVNDTITYTDLSHFNSRSAKDAFEGGMTLRNNFV